MIRSDQMLGLDECILSTRPCVPVPCHAMHQHCEIPGERSRTRRRARHCYCPWCANGFLNRNEGSVCLTDLSASTSPASTLCLVGDGVPFHLDLLTSASGSVAAVCEVPPPSLITLSSFLWDHFSLSSYSHRAAHSLISRTPRFGSQGNGKKTILAQTRPRF
jgi:hypothetical protein